MTNNTEQQAVPVAQEVRDHVVRFLQAENKSLGGMMFSPETMISRVASGAADSSLLVQAFAQAASLPCKSGEGAGERTWNGMRIAPQGKVETVLLSARPTPSEQFAKSSPDAESHLRLSRQHIDALLSHLCESEFALNLQGEEAATLHDIRKSLAAALATSSPDAEAN